MIKCRDKIEQLIRLKNIDMDKLKEFYKNNCAKETQLKFNLTYDQLNSLLYYYNIPKHTRQEASKLHSKHMKKRGPKTLNKINKEEFVKYYKGHSIIETCHHFNIVDETVKHLASFYNVTKSHSQIIQSKHEGTVRTCLKRYNTINGGCSQQALEKIRKVTKEKYGDENYFKTEDFKQKSNNTKLVKYGRIDIGQFGTEEHRKSMLEKYGVEFPMLSKEIREKLNNNMIKKYGVDRYAKTIEFHRKVRKRYLYNNEKFDSSWELALYIYAKDHNEEIIRCPCRFEYWFNGKKHYYFPDFLYKGNLIEIKGDNWFDSENNFVDFTAKDNNTSILKEKFNICLKNNVQVWRWKDIQYAFSYCVQKYNNKVWFK